MLRLTFFWSMKMTTSDRQLITARQVAEEFGMTLPQVYSATRDGIIPPVRIGKRLRYQRKKLDQWVANGGQGLLGGSKKEVRDDDS